MNSNENGIWITMSDHEAEEAIKEFKWMRKASCNDGAFTGLEFTKNTLTTDRLISAISGSIRAKHEQL